ncbi:MAG TPA: alanine dehydrogenase [Chloroflexi bacterium]|nr:alanine dehydrogenase [Chloroflexota bacterium]
MDIGIPVERHLDEYRVGLTPRGVYLLTQAGHRCYIEQGAGEGAGFEDRDYERAGGRIVYGAQEVYQRADLVLKVGSPSQEELEIARDEQTICAFWHLAARPRELTQALLQKGITAIAYETIQREDGKLPVLYPLSEIAGRMAPQVAARWLQNDGGGSGVLISGIAGIPPVEVCILGAGTVGTNAAVAFHGLGARISVLDRDLERLQSIEERFQGQVSTMVSYDFNIARALKSARILVGAVLVPGERAPVLVTREMVRLMRPRSVILDISIDQGGCVETSRPMTHRDPVFVEEGIIHYCVPNMPGVVARTATNAYLNAAWPYIRRLADEGTQAAIEADPDLRRGVAVHDGQIYNERLAALVMET